MVVEKIKNNKFKISVSIEDLKNEGINFHVFMSSNLESHELFDKILLKIEKDFNLFVNSENIIIDTFYITDSNFIIILTNKSDNDKNKPRVNVSRNIETSSNNINLYRFSSINELKHLLEFMKNTSSLFYNILKECPIYSYNDLSFLVINQNGISEEFISSLDKYLSEFSFKINKPNNFYIKLIEYGSIVTLF